MRETQDGFHRIYASHPLITRTLEGSLECVMNLLR